VNEVELGLPAFCLLTIISVVAGYISLWAFRHSSDLDRLRWALNRVVAHLFELRLFSDDPARVIRAQFDLLVANGALLRQVAVPSLILAIPFTLLFFAMDALLSLAPLQTGVPTIVTLQYRLRSGKSPPDVKLEAPPSIRVETRPVHIARLAQIAWRIRPMRSTEGHLKLNYNGQLVTKSISSVHGLQWLSDMRTGSRLGFLLHPYEVPFSALGIESVSVRYPRATLLHVNWTVWFCIGILVGSLGYAATLRFHY
jgi:hypothetical protein